MIFAARIGPTPNIRVRLVRLSSTTSWMLYVRDLRAAGQGAGQGAGRLLAGPRPTFAGYVRGRCAGVRCAAHERPSAPRGSSELRPQGGLSKQRMQAVEGRGCAP